MAVARLGDLRDELVFLGGCATGLLITDRGAPPIRMTRGSGGHPIARSLSFKRAVRPGRPAGDTGRH
jgi:hypothetical protein